MKKTCSLILCFAVVLLFAGCSDKESTAKNQSKQISENAKEEETKESKDSEGIDVDLTKMTSTMVYAEVYNMMVSPDDYIGKTVKIEGIYSFYHDDGTDKNYSSCVVQDATACCAQGIEFQLTDDYSYPDDYPTDGEEMTVIGTFDTYMEGENSYCTLREARLF